MAVNELPEGFVIDSGPPEGFVVDEPPQTQQKKPRSLSEEVFRGTALGARYLLETPGLMVAGAGDLLAKGHNKAADAVFGEGKGYRFPDGRAQMVSEGFDAMGFPQPEGRGEEYVADASRAAVGSLLGVGSGQALAASSSPVTANIGRSLASSPGMQAASAASGSVAGNVAQDMGAGPGVQLAASMAGGFAPGLTRYASQAAVRGGFRGGEAGRQELQGTIDDFERAGTSPTVGQGTQSRVARAVESGLSRAPGSAGRMAKTASDQADDVAVRIERRASELAGKTSAARAGRVIEDNVRGSGGFVEGFKAKQEQLYSTLDKWIDPESSVSVSNTQKTLSDMTRVIKGAERTSQRINNTAIQDIAADVAADAADGTVPFQALKELRSMVGEKVTGSSLVDDVSKAEWKRLYGALSKDLEAAAKSTGDENALAAWIRANKYTKAGHDRMDAISSVINKKGGPEKIFAAATSGTKEGATTLRSVMQSLDKEGQKVVTATVMRRLGLARAGMQNELGDQFSTETFLTNWNTLSAEAKSTLFSRYNASFRKDIDSIAKFAANLREGSQVFRNPSGTAQASLQYTTAGAFAMGVLTGNYGAAAAIAAGVAGSNRMAALMTNPRFVRWLARSTKAPIETLPVQLSILAQQAKEMKDEDLAWAVALLEESQHNQPNTDQGR